MQRKKYIEKEGYGEREVKRQKDPEKDRYREREICIEEKEIDI